MFLRWDRSNFRESLVQLSYMFSRYRPRNRLLPILDFVVRELEFPMTAIFLPLMLASFLCCPILIVKFVSGMALVSFLLTIYYLRQERDATSFTGSSIPFMPFSFSAGLGPSPSHLAGRPLVDAVAGPKTFSRAPRVISWCPPQVSNT